LRMLIACPPGPDTMQPQVQNARSRLRRAPWRPPSFRPIVVTGGAKFHAAVRSESQDAQDAIRIRAKPRALRSLAGTRRDLPGRSPPYVRARSIEGRRRYHTG